MVSKQTDENPVVNEFVEDIIEPLVNQHEGSLDIKYDESYRAWTLTLTSQFTFKLDALVLIAIGNFLEKNTRMELELTMHDKLIFTIFFP